MRKKLAFVVLAAVSAAFFACGSKPDAGPALWPGPSFPLVEESRVEFDGILLGGPRALGGDVVLSLASGRVLAVGAAPKKVLWQFSAKGGLSVPSLPGPDFVIVIDREGRMTRLARDGGVAWEKAVAGTVSAPPVLAAGAVLAVFDRRTVRAFDPATGAERWSWLSDADILTSARAWEDKAVLLTAAKKAVLLSPDGKPGPGFETADAASGPVLVSGDRLFAGFGNGTVQCWDLAARKRRWTVKTGALLAADPASGGTRIYAVTEGRQLFAVEKRSGNVAWWASLPGRAVGEAAPCGPRLLVPSLSPVLTAFDPATGKKAETVDLKLEIIAAPLVLADRVAVVGRDPSASKGAVIFLKSRPAPPEKKT